MWRWTTVNAGAGLASRAFHGIMSPLFFREQTGTATKRGEGKAPTWSDVKSGLSGFDRDAMLALVQSMYAANKDNQTFLHARLGLGADVLHPYKVIIARWLWPDVRRNQDISISTAKKAIADYKKAIGRPPELAELMAFYCEQAVGFCEDLGMQDERYFDALLSMFKQLLTLMPALEAGQRDQLLDRLEPLASISADFGYGVGDEMDALLDQYRSQVSGRPARRDSIAACSAVTPSHATEPVHAID